MPESSRGFWEISAVAKYPTIFIDPCIARIDKDCTAEDLKLFIHLWRIVSKYKDTAVYADDRMLTKEQVDDLILWMNCCANSVYFDNPSEYCFISPGVKHAHGWSCKKLHSVMRHGRFGRHNGIHWYTVGPFEDGIQYIDKQAIKDKLAAEAVSKCLQLCPMFSIDKAFQYVDQLPGQIDPRVESEWEYHDSEDELDKGAPIGVQPACVNERIV